MREEPPAELVDLLTRLGLADAAAIHAVQARARHLAGQLPLFSSVWVDALAQARLLTPFQAAEINAGRGEQLAVGPYRILNSPRRLGYADCYRARHVENGRIVDLHVAANLRAVEQSGALKTLPERLATADHPAILRAEDAGDSQGRAWIAYAPLIAEPLADWLARNGRLPGGAAAEVARQMATALATLERAGVVHGDISAATVSVGIGGAVQLTRSGLRGIWRPRESLLEADLPPEAYDYLAPERAEGSGPTVRSDLYACGLLLWHMLTGRVPLPGGDGRAKLLAAQAGKIDDVRRLAPETPAWLAEAIARYTRRDPQERPESFAELAETLGALSQSPGDRRLLTRTATVSAAVPARRRRPWKVRGSRSWAWIAAMAGSVAAVLFACVAWPSHEALPDHLKTAEPSRISHVSPQAMTIARPVQQPASDVRPAEFLTPQATERNADASHAPAALVLPADRPLVCNGAAWSALKPGQSVRGAAGSRPLLLVPPAGMLVTAENVQFENVDFVWLQSPAAVASLEQLAIVELRAARATFVGCTFQAALAEGLGRPAAIRWTGPVGRAAGGVSGRLELQRCVVQGTATGIEWRLSVPAAAQIHDTLHLGPGPLLYLPRLPRSDEAVAIGLRHVTLRSAGALLELHAETPTDAVGPMQLTADECAFAPRAGGALLWAVAAEPLKALRGIEWSGQGSLLTSGTPVAVRGNAGRVEPLAESELSIDGLVSSRVEFAGPAEAGPAGARIVRWQAPVASADPPGVGEDLPPLPPLPKLGPQSLDNSPR